MGAADKMWDALTTVIKMNDKVERMAGAMKSRQAKIESLTERVIRLETLLEIALAQQGAKPTRLKRIGKQPEAGDG
ncbi:putative Zn-dependent protease [Chromobacterium alkanivorans]|uniref:hypothetical protein n=1 Tax=Chromobacterium alkanivorans TaxID=1071719 RepID=UPI002168394B|nr:hypothetical protein [Chromobacterium alkanivorans]MCS3802785.1 putative Zn-dependent protease [Chromobacterium alkanivorans]MCS3817111.1 putative Zn-dependent protease [Chromobacterium alkanivorans]MCS3872151.1 putative Zn-dependent protease [Chromobacterium alkanivorans]